MWSVLNGHADATTLLLKYSALPNAVDKYKRTALHRGAALGREDCVDILFQYKVNNYCTSNNCCATFCPSPLYIRLYYLELSPLRWMSVSVITEVEMLYITLLYKDILPCLERLIG